MSYSHKFGGRGVNEGLVYGEGLLGSSHTHTSSKHGHATSIKNLTNFTPLDIYCPTFETSLEIIFNSKAGVAHNFSAVRASSRLDRWSCDPDGFGLHTSLKQ